MSYRLEQNHIPYEEFALHAKFGVLSLMLNWYNAEKWENIYYVIFITSFAYINIVYALRKCYLSILNDILKLMVSSRAAFIGLKGSYDAFLKIIILCIWCNRIC